MPCGYPELQPTNYTQGLGGISNSAGQLDIFTNSSQRSACCCFVVKCQLLFGIVNGQREAECFTSRARITKFPLTF